MKLNYRDLGYLWIGVSSLDDAHDFAADKFGLQCTERDDATIRFRSDARNYALCCQLDLNSPVVALSVAGREDLEQVKASLEQSGYSSEEIPEDLCVERQIKSGIAVNAPNGVRVEIVWRPLTSGWRAHAAIDSGITGLNAVALVSTNVELDEKFWSEGLGLTISDWIGEAVFLGLDDQHHRIAIYPSDRDGLLGVSFEVEDKNNLMVNWYRLKAFQVPIVAGPGRQAASNSMFVTTRGPGDVLFSYTVETDNGPHISERAPRQFSDMASSHCVWGSTTMQPEFLGREER